MKEILLYIWQLPQNLLALIMLLYYKKEEVYHRLNGRVFYYTKEMRSGISLGNYVIMNRDDMEDGMRHEYGHSIQSRYLGPVYLLFVGLPSIIGNIYDSIAHAKWPYVKSYEWYYNQPWEKWADELGGVDRAALIEQVREIYGDKVL